MIVLIIPYIASPLVYSNCALKPGVVVSYSERSKIISFIDQLYFKQFAVKVLVVRSCSRWLASYIVDGSLSQHLNVCIRIW